MDALKQSDKTEKELQRRILATYSSALTTITKNLAEFRTKMEQVEDGTIKPPAFYSTPEAVEKWKQGFVTQLMRQYKIQETIMEEINRAGAKASEQIRESMADVYMDNLGEAQTLIEAGVNKAGVNASFAMPKREEVRVILDDSQGTFSKLAYHNLGQNETVRKRLQSELAQATALGESQRKIMARIRNVTGQSVKQAKRVAQTERTRVQSQARWNAAQEAAKQGVQTYNEWRCRFVNSRDAHMERHGKRVLQGQTFPDSVMRYPGDPNGSAEEVINCHCYLQVGVLLHGETLDSDGNIVKADSLQSTNESFGTEGEKQSTTEARPITKSARYAIDATAIESREYVNKLDQIAETSQERREFLKAAKEMLHHRSGQNGEDLYLYNRATKQWTKSTTGKLAEKTEYTDEIKNTIRKAKQGELIAFHNHPASMPPSPDDVNAVKQNGYSEGIVLCHNGNVFRYTAPRREVSSYLYTAMVAKYKSKDYNEYEAQLKAMKELSELLDFDFEEVK